MTDRSVVDTQALSRALGELASLPPDARVVAERAVGEVVRLYQQGVDRLLVLGHDSGQIAVDDLVADPVWTGLLCLHGAHPVPLEQRVGEALAGVRPLLGSHSGDVRLVRIDGDVVRIELLGGCDGCAASTQTLRGLIETAVTTAAPEIAAVELEERTTEEPPLLQILTRRPDDITCPVPAGG